ncbi:MAG: hypothetical protein AAF438_00225 [Pseudomonadota bacterium]
MDRFVFCLIASLCSLNSAYGYQFEIDLEYAHQRTKLLIPVGITVPGGGQTLIQESNNETTTAGASYFFSPIPITQGPIREQAFLGKNSSVSLGYTNNDSRTTVAFPPFFSSRQETDSDSYEISSQLVLGPGNWIATVGYTGFDGATAGENTFSVDTRSDTFQAGFGKYITPTTTLVLGYSHSEARQTILETGLGIFLGPNSFSFRQENVSFNGRHLMQLGNRHLLIQGTLGTSKTSGSALTSDGSLGNYALGAAFFPRRNLGLGIATGGTFDEPTGTRDTTSFSIVIDWFVSPLIAINSGYRFSDFEERDDEQFDDDGFFLQLTSRW